MSSRQGRPRPDGGDPSVRHTTDPHPRVAGQPHRGTDAARATKARQAEVFTGDTTGNTRGTQARQERIFQQDKPSS